MAVELKYEVENVYFNFSNENPENLDLEKEIFENEVLQYIIETYTFESGCRKIKEILSQYN